MASTPRAIRTLPIAVAIAIAFAPAMPGIAQTRDASTVDTITVVAPRITYQVRRERGSTVPVRIETAEKTAEVRYDDLDLTRTADLYRLEQRIDEAANRVCTELAQQFPDGEPSTAVCARRAIDDAMAQVRRATRMSAR